MFFPRLRKRAKWVFLFLALAFAFGFVGFGVGAGGSGIGDYFAELFNRVPSTGQPDIDDAKKEAKAHPTDGKAQLALVNAYQAEGETENAVTAMTAYLTLNPDDADALQQLASLYLTEGTEAQQTAQNAQASGGAAAFASILFNSQGAIGKSLVAPITDQQQQKITSEYTNALIKGQAAFTNEADTWDKLIALKPDEKSFYLSLAQAAQQANDLNRAVKAYEAYLVASPDDPNEAQIKDAIKQLKAALKSQGQPGQQ
jgi:tetratricopeptide (TPR) repeat protein